MARAGKPSKPTATKLATDVDRAIGIRIRLRRTELGLSQKEVGQRLGVTRQQVTQYEAGAVRVGGSLLARIAEALEAPVSYFFDQSAADVEVTAAALLKPHGAVALVRAYAAIKDPRQRAALVTLARALAGQEPLQDSSAEG